MGGGREGGLNELLYIVDGWVSGWVEDVPSCRVTQQGKGVGTWSSVVLLYCSEVEPWAAPLVVNGTE